MRCVSGVRLGLLTPAVVLAFAMLFVASGLARAETYGEMGHFGSAGTGHAQFRLTGPTINGTDGTRAFGVDTSENAVYVGDEPKAKEYRIQKLTSAGAFVAATAGFKPPNRQGLEGIAFDPVLKRLYVLALERRGALLESDPGKPAAGTLYAFSTDESGEVLPPASGTVEGVLTGPATLHPQSDAPADALIRPKGIAVDPTTHDVIVTGELAEGGEVHSFALQRIDASTGALGARYVDKSGMLVDEKHPNSPVVSASGAVYLEQTEQVEVEFGGKKFSSEAAQLVRIPDFNSPQPPTPFINFISSEPGNSEDNPVVQFDDGHGESLEDGGGLSFSPETGGDGTLYAEAGVFEQTVEGQGSYYTGALAFKDVKDSEGLELGWTGGQSRQIGESCAIAISGPTAPMVAGGAGGTVFVLDTKSARVVEFGLGGSGCPTAEAGEIAATTNGTPLSGTIPAGTEVTLATNLTRANALSVEWSFGEGEAKPLLVSADEYQHTQVTHRFEKGGELTVTETIHTDNLATPTILRTIKIPVSVNHLPPTAVISGPLTIGMGQAATFDGGASWDPNGTPGSSPVKSYHWDFGDGASTVSETPEVEHTYAQTGLYVAKLVVVNGYGLESEPSKIDVTVDIPAPPKSEPPPSSPPGSVTGSPVPISPIEQTPTPSTGGLPTPPPIPDARLASASLSVATNGTVSTVVTCPSGESDCDGTVTLRTLGAVSVAARGHKQPKKTVLTLAKGAFAIAGGRQQSLSLRLSAAGRKLLGKSGALRVRAIVVAHDSAGATHTAQSTVTLHTGTARKGSAHGVRAGRK